MSEWEWVKLNDAGKIGWNLEKNLKKQLGQKDEENLKNYLRKKKSQWNFDHAQLIARVSKIKIYKNMIKSII